MKEKSREVSEPYKRSSQKSPMTIHLNEIKIKMPIRKRLEVSNAEDHKVGIHACLRYTLLSCRWMGLLPVSGLTRTESTHLRCCTKDLYCALYGLSVMGQLMISLLALHRQLVTKLNIGELSNTLFYLSGLVSVLLMTRLAVVWRRLVRKIEKLEANLPKLGQGVVVECNRIMFFVLATAAVEHILSVLYGYKMSSLCEPDHNTDQMWEAYFVSNMPWVFEYFSFSLWKAVIAEISNIQSTFMWSFNDLFIMVCSVYLRNNFDIVAISVKKVHLQESFNWHVYRQQYWVCVKILKILNEEIGIYIVTSLGSNLYWICVQLFNSLSSSNTGHYVSFCNVEVNNSLKTQHMFYFAYSFTFLVVRTTLVALLAANIHVKAMKPLAYLYDVPNLNYNIEVKRFIDQIRFTEVALNGMHFFVITRGTILKILGTILTYELVLLQLSGGAKYSGHAVPLENKTFDRDLSHQSFLPL